jgi:hypothetical protein
MAPASIFSVLPSGICKASKWSDTYPARFACWSLPIARALLMVGVGERYDFTFSHAGYKRKIVPLACPSLEGPRFTDTPVELAPEKSSEAH